MASPKQNLQTSVSILKVNSCDCFNCARITVTAVIKAKKYLHGGHIEGPPHLTAAES